MVFLLICQKVLQKLVNTIFFKNNQYYKENMDMFLFPLCELQEN